MKTKINLLAVLIGALALLGSSVVVEARGNDFEQFINVNTSGRGGDGGVGPSLADIEAAQNFDSFIDTTTGVTQPSNGVRTPKANLPQDVFSSEQSNIGGSIYVPYDGPVFNGPGLEGGALLAERELDDNVSKERDLKALIIGWTNFILSVAALLAVVALVWAGVLYITAAGDDSRMETAKKIVIWVVVGILLILASYAIVNTVMQAVF